jgi:hypothetical protein
LLTVACDGSNSVREVSYTFTFGDDFVASGTDPTVSHTYLDITALSNPVRLVVRDALGRTSSDTWSPS